MSEIRTKTAFDREATRLRALASARKTQTERDRRRRARKALTEAQIQAGLKLDDEALKMLEDMSRGKAPRHAQAILSAIRLRLDFTAVKPQTEVKHSGGLNIQVNTLAPHPPIVRKVAYQPGTETTTAEPGKSYTDEDL